MTASDSRPAFAGLNLADELKDYEPGASSTPKSDPAALREISTRAGFPSREPQLAAAKAPAVQRPLNFDTRLTLRVASEDKTRFEDLVYALRSSNGDVFRKALSALEAEIAGAKSS